LVFDCTLNFYILILIISDKEINPIVYHYVIVYSLKEGVVVLFCLKMYEDATKEELIDKIKQLERHVMQLKNVIAKSQVFNVID